MVRIHFIIDLIWWTGLAPYEYEFLFPGSLISIFLEQPWTWLKLRRYGQQELRFGIWGFGCWVKGVGFNQQKHPLSPLHKPLH